MMDTVVCPQCGSVNPSENERCQWCLAPLYPVQDSEKEPSSVDLPDWLKDAETPLPFPESQEEELPDWLLALRQEGESTSLEEPLQAESEAEEFLAPDLEEILSLGEEKGETFVESSLPLEPSESETFPSWISQNQPEEGSTPAPTASSGIVSAGQPEDELPDWLKALREKEETPAAEMPAEVGEEFTPPFLPEAPPTPELEGMPEWLTDLPGVSTEDKGIGISDSALKVQESETIAESGAERLEGEPSAGTPPFTEIPEDLTAWYEEEPAFSSEEQTALSTISSSPTAEKAFSVELPSAEEAREETPLGTPPFSEEEYTAWLDQINLDETLIEEKIPPRVPAFTEEVPAESSQTPEGVIPPFIESELPQWLAESPTDESMEAAVASAAELPEWLEAMRPVEAVAPLPTEEREEDARIETSGPLAGYQGILPGEPEALRYSRPPVHAVRLNISEKQRAYVALLESLVSAESTPISLRVQKPVSTTSPVLRLAVTILLLVILLLGLTSGVPISALPSLFPAEAVTFATTVNTLASVHPAPRVLVGVEVDAGFLPEIHTASVNVLSDLMRQNARLVFITTQSNASVLALTLAQQAAQQVPEYNLPEQSLNLGYLAGEATGLSVFAHRPPIAVTTTLDGQMASNALSLLGITGLQDFDAILLVTDSGERARAWLEQVRPLFPERPLLVIASAQAAPYLTPYVQSGQVNGLISGLVGSITYLRLTQRVGGENPSLWGTYQMGTLTIALLILLGGLASTLQAVFPASKTPLRR
ncbi:MAG: hypothetical protein N3A60_01680 [Thermanaerothrix sp.]|nr:hypothetical protein [Thermanaerothrix sp.]